MAPRTELEETVRRGDPDRWRTGRLAPAGRRDGLFALYAFNLEIARAPWVTSEPLLAEIRLQWWRDALAEIYDGREPRRHEVVTPLAVAIAAGSLPRAPLEAMIDARRRDTETAPAQNAAAIRSFAAASAGSLMWLAARYLGARAAAEPAVRRFGAASGVAAYLRALPGLAASGRAVPDTQTVAALAGAALEDLRSARAERQCVDEGALAAMLVGWMAEARLRRAGAAPERVVREGLEFAPVRARASLAARVLAGRW